MRPCCRTPHAAPTHARAPAQQRPPAPRPALRSRPRVVAAAAGGGGGSGGSGRGSGGGGGGGGGSDGGGDDGARPRSGGGGWIGKLGLAAGGFVLLGLAQPWAPRQQPLDTAQASVAVIVPVLNEAAGVLQTLRALAELQPQPAEVIVVDGGSTDGCATARACPAPVRPRLAGGRARAARRRRPPRPARARAAPRSTPRLVRRSGLARRVLASGRGRAVQMNAGAAAARSELLCFLHADTTPPRDLVAVMRRELADPRTVLGGFVPSIEGAPRPRPRPRAAPARAAHRGDARRAARPRPRARAVEGRRLWALSANNFLKTYYGPLLVRPLSFLRGLRCLFGDQTLFCRARDLRRVGGFDARLSIFEDADLCIRLHMAGPSPPPGAPQPPRAQRGPLAAWRAPRGRVVQVLDRASRTSGRRLAAGVFWDKKNGRWRAQVGHNNRKVFLGYFDRPADAARAYDAKAVQLRGALASTNFALEHYAAELRTFNQGRVDPPAAAAAASTPRAAAAAAAAQAAGTPGRPAAAHAEPQISSAQHDQRAPVGQRRKREAAAGADQRRGIDQQQQQQQQPWAGWRANELRLAIAAAGQAAEHGAAVGGSGGARGEAPGAALNVLAAAAASAGGACSPAGGGSPGPRPAEQQRDEWRGAAAALCAALGAPGRPQGAATGPGAVPRLLAAIAAADEERQRQQGGAVAGLSSALTGTDAGLPPEVLGALEPWMLEPSEVPGIAEVLAAASRPGRSSEARLLHLLLLLQLTAAQLRVLAQEDAGAAAPASAAGPAGAAAAAAAAGTAAPAAQAAPAPAAAAEAVPNLRVRSDVSTATGAAAVAGAAAAEAAAQHPKAGDGAAAVPAGRQPSHTSSATAVGSLGGAPGLLPCAASMRRWGSGAISMDGGAPDAG
ncbi:AP2-5 [Scenedesmus sp. PABB004]|nr:AP2-5 [Scenedesmus sp. PABB004]